MWIFLIIIGIIILFKTITIKIEIENLNVNIPSIYGKYINDNSIILMKIYVLKKIKIKKINLRKIQLQNTKLKRKFEKIIKDKSRLKFNLNILSIFINDEYKIEKMNLKVNIGFENAAITAISVGVIYSLISIISNNKLKYSKYSKYKIIPVYENKNIIEINFDGIFSLDITNIIDIVKLLRKGGVKNNDRTSNRRSYVYSNE